MNSQNKPKIPTQASVKPVRAMVFIDGQNLFHRVKSIFGRRDPDFDIRGLSDALCERAGWEPAGIYFYSGIPGSTDSPHWNRFWNDKLAHVQADGGTPVKAFTPPLQYHEQWTQRNDGQWHIYRCPREKGVDVRMSLDMVAATYEKSCDAMIVMTCDSDFAEAVQRCMEISKSQGRNLHIANAFPQRVDTDFLRPGLLNTSAMRFDQDFYEAHLDAHKGARFGKTNQNFANEIVQSASEQLNRSTNSNAAPMVHEMQALERGQRAMQAALPVQNHASDDHRVSVSAQRHH